MPSNPLNLLVPSSVAGATLGYTANKAGIWISPPPPTIASMSPAANAAASTSKRSNDNCTPAGYLQVGPWRSWRLGESHFRVPPDICCRPPTTIESGELSMRALLRGLLLGCLLLTAGPVLSQDVWDQVEHRYADSSGVKIHYAVLGEGP